MSTREAGFAQLLTRVGHAPAAAVTICHQEPGRPFTVTWTTAELAPEVADTYAATSDVWFNVNGLWSRDAGRGRTQDVTRLAALWADLDVKPGGLPTMQVANDVIDALSTMLGTRPVAVVSSGHGLQPYWAVDPEAPAAQLTDDTRAGAAALATRFGRLVAHVAEKHGGHVDSVFDLARVLRVPGTVNHKGKPVPVTVALDTGRPLDVAEIHERLIEYGVTEQPGDQEAVGEVQAPVGDWQWGAGTHPAVTRAMASWGTQRPRSRHPWLLGYATSLAFAHRLGWITETDHAEAVRTLAGRFGWLLANSPPNRPAAPGEVAGCFAKGVAVAERKHHADVLADWDFWVALVADDHDPEEQPAAAAPDEDTFWTARDTLTHLRTFARARRAAPWAVLGAALARVVVVSPPHLVLPPLVGSDASLNLFVAVVAESGGGKGASVGAASDAVSVGHITSHPVGSGEGLTHLFVRRTKTGLEQHTTAVLAEVGEVDTLTALNSRQGSTLQPVLRQAYMGEEFGFGYADPLKRLVVPAHQYRLSLIVGVQPKRAGGLLDDADGGTPQRLLWLPAVDRDAPETAPEAPARLHWRMPDLPPHSIHDGRVRMPVCETARVSIDTARLARLQGDGEALDGHALLTRLKVAAALGLLDGRVEVSEQDWELSGTVMAVSDATRERIVAELGDVRRRSNRARGHAEAERAEMVTERVQGVAIRRVAQVLHRALAAVKATGMTGGVLRRSVHSRDRHLVDEALDQLLTAGRIVAEELAPDETGGGGFGLRYWVSEAKK